MDSQVFPSCFFALHLNAQPKGWVDAESVLEVRRPVGLVVRKNRSRAKSHAH